MTNGNEPAFASGVTCNENGIYTGADAPSSGGGNGLPKREYFAAMAMQGLCADRSMTSSESIVALAVGCADALIAELNKEVTV